METLYEQLLSHNPISLFDFKRSHFKLILDSKITFPKFITFSLPSIFIGDVHGDFQALQHVINNANSNIVVLGDLLDRGFYQLECLFLIILGAYLKKITFIVGNHDIETVAGFNSFKEEIERRGFIDLYDDLKMCLSKFSLCGGTLNRNILCVHGMFDTLKSLDDIKKSLNEYEFLIPSLKLQISNQITWSDINFDTNALFEPKFNTLRKVGMLYSKDSVVRWMDVNKVDIIIRGHQHPQKGILNIDNRIFTIDNHGVEFVNLLIKEEGSQLLVLIQPSKRMDQIETFI